MKRRGHAPVALVTLLGAFAAGCVREPPPTVQIAISASPGAEVLYLAQERGLFAGEGVAVRLIEHSTASDVRRAYERGQADGMVASLAEVLHVRDESTRSPQVVLVTDSAGNGATIVARPPLARVADLRGRRVAAEPASVSTYVLLEALARAELTLADVVFVPVDAIEMPGSLSRGDVDAVVSYAPWLQEILRAGDGRVLHDVEASDALDVLAIEADVIGSRPTQVEAIIRTWDRALKALADTHDESVRVMAARERLSPREFEPLLRRAGLQRSDQQERLLTKDGAVVRSLAHLSKILRDNGQLTGPDRTAGSVAPQAVRGPGAT
jgi:NitT/TauT family transport system substrate-binding protein